MDCDVLIAGGGTSGAYAAYLLSRAGIKVIVAEKRMDAGSPPSGMGLISENSAIKYLDEFVNRSVTTHNGISVEGLSGNFRINFREGNGIMQFSRDKLDKHILAASGNNGAEILIRTEVLDCVQENNGVRATIKSEGKTKEIVSRHLLIATGADPGDLTTHGAECQTSVHEAILRRGFLNQASENQLSLKLEDNKFTITSRNSRFWEYMETFTGSSSKSVQEGKNNAPSTEIRYHKKMHTCTPDLGENIFAIGEAAGLWGRQSGFGMELALESARCAYMHIRNQMENGNHENFSAKIDKLKMKNRKASDISSILSGEISGIEDIIASLKANSPRPQD